MAQQHMDRLSGVDASFLHQEGPATHMHIGGVAIFEGPAPPLEEMLAHISGRLALVPRYRQKIATPPRGLGRQRWIDDPNFNIAYHVRNTALPAPGTEEQLLRLVARVFSQALDRTKPLWELWLVERLSGGRFALISKIHHSLVDGVSGVDLMTMLFDITRVPRTVGGDSWHARPEPTPVELSATAVLGWAGALASLPVRAAAAAASPEQTLGRVRDAAEGVAELARSIIGSAPESPLNVPIGPHRRVAFVPARLDDFKLVKNAFGGTVNDVVLAVVAGALERYYWHRGLPTAGVELRAAVPVSTRASDEHAALGNRVAQVIAPLPIHIDDPVARLRHVKRAMDGIKESKQALGAEVIVAAEDFAPPTILAQASRLNFSNRLFNLLITNVPGPQFAIYALGRELQAIYPIAFLAGDRALSVAIMSYDGGVYFGLLADYDTLDDLEVIADGISASLAELVELAREHDRGLRGAQAKGRRAPKGKPRPAAKSRPAAKPRPAPKARAAAKNRPAAKDRAAVNGRTKA